MTFNWKNVISLGKKEILGGFIISVVTFIGLCIGFRYNHHEVYYQVIFDSNGGSEVAGRNVLIGSQVAPPSATTREGYIFKGWYLGKEKYDFSTKVRSDITLRAKWQKISDIIDEKKVNDKVNNSGADEKKTTNDSKSDSSSSAATNNGASNNSSSNTQSSNNVSTPFTTVVNVSSISLNTSSLSLKIGDSANLRVSIQPANATNKTVTWSSTNSGIVSVSNGTIRAISSGTAIITASVGGKTASCTVTVPKNITYSYEMVDVPSSAIGQCYIYIKRSDGQRVGGTIEIVYINGNKEEVQVSSSGVMRVRSTISSVRVISAG